MTFLQDSYDFVAVGGGIAGLAAGVAAADRGMTVAVLEKTETFGGVTAYSNGQLWVPASDQQIAAGLEDSPEDGAAYLERLGMGFASRRHIDAYVHGARRFARYFEKVASVRWHLVRGLPDYYYPDFDSSRAEGRYLEVEPYLGADLGEWRGRLRTSPHVAYRLTHEDIWALGGGGRSHNWDQSLPRERVNQDALCMGTGLAAYLLSAAVRLGVDLVADAHVTGLLREHDRVTGIRVEGRGDPVTVRGGVLLATGGYDWDTRSMRAFEGHPEIASAAPPSVVGDHLSLAMPIGARVTQLPKPIRLGYPLPFGQDDGHQMTGIFRAAAYPHAILVNRSGRRFCDEAFYPSIGHALKVIDGRDQSFQNWPCWMIFDDQFRSTYTVGGVSPGDAVPQVWEWTSAPTLEELGRLIGVDPTGLRHQVEEFNATCERGNDEAFKRGGRPWSQRSYGDSAADGHPNLGTIAEPPFYAWKPVLVGTGIPTLGLDTDPVGRVLGDGGESIPGLYAAGNSSALHEVGAGYQSGVANTRSLVVAGTAVEDSART